MRSQTFDALLWFVVIYIGPTVYALGFTLLVELSVAFAMGWRTRNDLGGVAAVSLITNPFFVLSVYLLVLVFRDLPPGFLFGFMIALEVVIVLVEWRLLRWALKKDSRKTVVLSVVMNATSFLLGLIVLGARV